MPAVRDGTLTSTWYISNLNVISSKYILNEKSTLFLLHFLSFTIYLFFDNLIVKVSTLESYKVF